MCDPLLFSDDTLERHKIGNQVRLLIPSECGAIGGHFRGGYESVVEQVLLEKGAEPICGVEQLNAGAILIHQTSSERLPGASCHLIPLVSRLYDKARREKLLADFSGGVIGTDRAQIRAKMGTLICYAMARETASFALQYGSSVFYVLALPNLIRDVRRLCGHNPRNQ